MKSFSSTIQMTPENLINLAILLKHQASSGFKLQLSLFICRVMSCPFIFLTNPWSGFISCSNFDEDIMLLNCHGNKK